MVSASPVVVPVPVLIVNTPEFDVQVWLVAQEHVAPDPAAGPTTQETRVVPIYFGAVTEVLKTDAGFGGE
jgi:hypothetical protein